MNVNDTEIAWSILKDSGFEQVTTVDEVIDTTFDIHCCMSNIYVLKPTIVVYKLLYYINMNV